MVIVPERTKVTGTATKTELIFFASSMKDVQNRYWVNTIYSVYAIGDTSYGTGLITKIASNVSGCPLDNFQGFEN